MRRYSTCAPRFISSNDAAPHSARLLWNLCANGTTTANNNGGTEAAVAAAIRSAQYKTINKVVEEPNLIERCLPERVLRLHADAVARGATSYTDPATGNFVFSRVAHLQRGGLAVTAIFGALVALPALRLQGIYLALATAALAILVYQLVFLQPAVMPGNNRQVPALGVGDDDGLVVQHAQTDGIHMGPQRLARLVHVATVELVVAGYEQHRHRPAAEQLEAAPRRVDVASQDQQFGARGGHRLIRLRLEMKV